MMPVKANKKVKIAVLGCGRQAWLGYFPWFGLNRNAELAAICDTDEKLLEKSAKKFGAKKTYTDAGEMIDKCGADAMIITTPPWFHHEPAAAAAAKGMHVLCEKPLATLPKECKVMVNAAKKHGVIIDTAHSLRFDPGYEKLKMIIKNGDIGRVFQLRATYDGYIPDLTKSPVKEIHELGGRLRIFQNADMGAWRMKDERTRGGVFFDHGIHYVDLFQWIMDEKAKVVGGLVQRVHEGRTYEDHGSALLRFESGACAYVQGSMARLSAHTDLDEGLIHGDAGCLKYRMDQLWYVMGLPYLNNVHARVWKYGLASYLINRWLPVPVKHGRDHNMFKRQFDHFVGKVNGTLEPHPVFGLDWAASVEDGMRNVEIVHEVYASSGGIA